MSDGGHGVDMASVIPKSDAMRRPGYTISKYGTGIWFTHASICRCYGTESTVLMAAWAMNQLQGHLLSRSDEEMSSRAIEDIDWIRVNACTGTHL